MFMIWKHMTTLCQQLQISHYRLLLEYPRFVPSVTNGTPVLPLDLCSAHSWAFTFCLQQQMIWLKQKFSDAEVEKIDDQFRNLRLAFKEQSVFSQMLQTAQACSTVQSFEQCWSPLGSEFEDLQRFCGAIASIMPGTSSVESDFSLINCSKDSSSQSLTDFSLESILHCKQYQKLRDLFE